jgi:hypothetical protein
MSRASFFITSMEASMGRKSKIESHPQSKIIIKRLASGAEYSTILLDFPQLTRFDLDYYVKNKLPELLSKSGDLKAELTSDQGNDTLAEVRALKTRAIDILEQAQRAGDLRTALLGIREARGCLELSLKAEGRISSQKAQLNVVHLNANKKPGLFDRIDFLEEKYGAEYKTKLDALEPVYRGEGFESKMSEAVEKELLSLGLAKNPPTY